MKHEGDIHEGERAPRTPTMARPGAPSLLSEQSSPALATSGAHACFSKRQLSTFLVHVTTRPQILLIDLHVVLISVRYESV